MPRRTFALLALILPLLSVSLTPVALVHAVGYALLGSSLLPDSQDVKFPQVATGGGAVAVSGNANQSDAQLWQKSDTALSFPNPQRVGDAIGTPDYSTTHLVYAPNGALYYFWSNFLADRRIYMAVRLPGGSFGPATPVLTSNQARFPSHFDAVARSDNTVFLFWRDFNSDTKVPIRYRIITVSGNVPTPNPSIGSVDERVALPSLRAAAGPSGQIAVGYTLASGNAGKLQAIIAIWNGSGFSPEPASEPNGEYADPMPAIAPDGKYFVTYRGVGSATDGTWYSERQPNGAWPPSRLYKGKTDWSSLVIDPSGNLHLFWTNQISGSPHLYYQVKLAGQAFDTSLYDAGSGTYFNVDGNVSVSDHVFGHAVLEDFNGSAPNTKYFLFSTDISVISAGAISIDGGQQFTRKVTLPVTFSGVVGDQNTMEVRYHWGSPPTDADTFVKFANPLNVPAPTLANPSACTTQTLYTQLRVGSTVQATPNLDSIIFDKAVQATAALVNPNSAYDPAYTASKSAVLKVLSPGECIGLSVGSVSGDITAPPQSLAINGDRSFQTTLALSGTEGLRTVAVSLSDLLGNSSGSLPASITYDATKPVLTSTGIVTATADTTDPTTNIYGKLEISGATLTDSSGIFGLLIQNTVTPTGGSPVVGQMILVPFSSIQGVTQAGGKVSLSLRWILLMGIPPASQVPGTYQFTAYFVDKAGNPSDQVAAQSSPITLAQLRLIKTELPLVRR